MGQRCTSVRTPFLECVSRKQEIPKRIITLEKSNGQKRVYPYFLGPKKGIGQNSIAFHVDGLIEELTLPLRFIDVCNDR